jgi:hypothetical protein
LCIGLLIPPFSLAVAAPVAQDAPPGAAIDGPDDAKFVEPAAQQPMFDAAQAAPVLGPNPLPLAELSPAQAGPFYICGNADGFAWSTTSLAFQIVRQCTMRLPQAGHVYIVGNASMGRSGGDMEAIFGLGIDAPTPMTDVERRVSVTSSQPNKSVVASAMKPIAAGDHTFYFVARRNIGTGSVSLTAPTFSVIFIPSTAPYQVCTNTLNGDWFTDSTDNQIVLSCSNIAASGNGFIFYAANTWLRRTDGAYEAVLWMNIDGAYKDTTARWQNAYNDFTNGTDDTLAITGIHPVSAGVHTVDFLTRKRAGSGQVTLTDPNIAAFYFPATDPNVKACGDLPGDSWYTSFSNYQDFRVCPLIGSSPGPMHLTAPTVLLLSSDGTAGSRYDLDNQAFQMGVRLGVLDPNGFPETTRQFNVFDDGGDYSDTTFSASALVGLQPGYYLFYSSGARISGPGEATINRGGLTAIAFSLSLDKSIYLPFIAR